MSRARLGSTMARDQAILDVLDAPMTAKEISAARCRSTEPASGVGLGSLGRAISGGYGGSTARSNASTRRPVIVADTCGRGPSKAGRYEYRVWWQREGHARRSQIMQTEAGARSKADRLVRLDTEKCELYDEDDYGYQIEHPLVDMPDLAGPPLIDRRTVGEWEPLP